MLINAVDQRSIEIEQKRRLQTSHLIAPVGIAGISQDASGKVRTGIGSDKIIIKDGGRTIDHETVHQPAPYRQRSVAAGLAGYQ